MIAPVLAPWTMSQYAVLRENAGQAFVRNVLGDEFLWQPLPGDASTRRYFRVKANGGSYILMDSPLPPRSSPYIFAENFQVSAESVQLFQQRSEQFRRCALPVPDIIASDDKNAFLLLEDFGERWLWYDLTAKPLQVMPQALHLLGWWQQQTRHLFSEIPEYSAAFLQAEVKLCQDYFIAHYLGMSGSRALEPLMLLIPELCTDTGETSGYCIHRDWHSRNLMSLPNSSIGILDYQDALWGHPAYDLVSLTRDCYQRYPAAWVKQWEEDFRRRFHPGISVSHWQKACDAVALQRHLKVLGIFVRLADEGKTGYLSYLPQVMKYALAEACRLTHVSRCVDLSELIGLLAVALQKADNG